MKFLFFLLVALLGGCNTFSIPSVNSPDIIQWSDFKLENWGTQMWAVAIKQEKPNARIFNCHGSVITEGVLKDGQIVKRKTWIACPDRPRSDIAIKDVAIFLRKSFPNDPIYILSCNPGCLDLDLPNVWYAYGSVWNVPDFAAPFAFLVGRETRVGKGDVGTLGEFVTQGHFDPKKYPHLKVR